MAARLIIKATMSTGQSADTAKKTHSSVKNKCLNTQVADTNWFKYFFNHNVSSSILQLYQTLYIRPTTLLSPLSSSSLASGTRWQSVKSSLALLLPVSPLPFPFPLTKPYKFQGQPSEMQSEFWLIQERFQLTLFESCRWSTPDKFRLLLETLLERNILLSPFCLHSSIILLRCSAVQYGGQSV